MNKGYESTRPSRVTKPSLGFIISRKEAKEAGMTRFFTGVPCTHGHIVDRLTSNGNCAECNALAGRKYRPPTDQFGEFETCESFAYRDDTMSQFNKIVGWTQFKRMNDLDSDNLV